MEGVQGEASFNEGLLCAHMFHRCYLHPPTKELLSRGSRQCHLPLHPHAPSPRSLHPSIRAWYTANIW